MTIRDELIEALRGLTFKFEIKISDVLVDENPNEAAPSVSVEAKPQRGTVDDILPSLINRLPASSATLPAKVSSPMVNETVSSVREAPRERLTSNIRPKIMSSASSFTEPKREPIERKLIETPAPPPQAEPIKPKQPEPVVQKAEVVAPKTVSEPEPKMVRPSLVKRASANPLVKGSLRVGAFMKSFCIWIAENNIAYISYDNERLLRITQMINNMAISIETQPHVSNVDVGDIVFAKSKDDNAWYRALIQRKDEDNVDVFFFDWGGKETLGLTRLRRLAVLELGLSAEPASAMKIKILNPPGPTVDKFLECEAPFDIKVESYDDFEDFYAITILRQSEE